MKFGSLPHLSEELPTGAYPMKLNRSLKPSDVLILAAEGERRELLGRAMRKEDLKPHFTASAETVPELLASLKPATLLHDWPAIEPTLAVKFQQRLGKNSEYASLCRIIYADALTPQLLALAHDSGVRRVISRATGPTALVAALKMALTTLQNMPDLQRLMFDEQNGVKRDQNAIDQRIRAAYGLFSHDPAVQLEFAQLCVRERSFKAAVEIADAMIAKDATNVRALNLRARIWLLEGRTDQAAELLEKANVLSPFCTERLVLLGDAFFAKGNKESAAKYYCEALQLDAKNEDAARGVVSISLNDADVNFVFTMIRDSLSEDEAAALFNNAAVLAARAKNTTDSIRLYENALRVVQNERLRAAVHFNIGLSYSQSGKKAEAQKNFAKCLRLDPGFDKARRYVKEGKGA